MTSQFQTAVKSAVPDTHRRAVIDRMIERDDRTNLALLVRMGGLRGEFRRRALEGLAACDGTDELAVLAEETALEPSLRRRATELS